MKINRRSIGYFQSSRQARVYNFHKTQLATAASRGMKPRAARLAAREATEREFGLTTRFIQRAIQSHELLGSRMIQVVSRAALKVPPQVISLVDSINEVLTPRERQDYGAKDVYELLPLALARWRARALKAEGLVAQELAGVTNNAYEPPRLRRR